ncbi:SCO1664 family protein [Nocardioides salsibiostraticola]
MTTAALDGEIVLQGRIMPASNATFLGEIGGTKVVYKPVAGERPLWDFPTGTLADREVGAHSVSVTLGWDTVPLTWMGEGPHGPGMVQVWQDADPDQEAVTIVRTPEVTVSHPSWLSVFEGLDDRDREVTLIHEDTTSLRRMAIFDVITNNADRKGGHVIEMASGHRYGVDHGLTLHHESKLRTVLWGWRGQPLTDDELDGVRRVVEGLGAALGDDLATRITDLELHALERRCQRLLREAVMPDSHGDWPSIPWPPF